MIKLARIFTDGMVLQRQKPLKLWGETDRAQRIRVTINDELVFDGACEAGEFSIVLPPMEALFDATLTLQCEEDGLCLSHVDIGEVWIAGGQSNMEFPLRFDEDAPAVLASAQNAHLRFYDTPKYAFEGEEAEGYKDASHMGKWLCFTPQEAGYFSAVGAYFAQSLRLALDVPIGIVGCNWGGTTALAWLDEAYLQENPKLAPYLEDYRRAVEKLDLKKYAKKGRKVRELIASDRMQRMQDNMLQGVSRFSDTIRALPAALNVIGYTATKGPADPNRPAGLFNMMVKTIAGYSCRGVLWYHGESDTDKAENYANLCSAVIKCWRDGWQEELPYLLVQLAPYEKSQLGSGEKFPLIREQQELVCKSTPGTYLVSIMDCGEKNDIHPKRKRPVGERLALLARGKIYGEPLLCDPPELSSASFAKGAITLRFADAGEGLRLEAPLFSALKIKVGGKAVSGFSVQIDNDSIEIRSGEFKAKAHVEVLFAWSGYCEVNLFNSAGLAAKPFKIAGEIPS